MPATATKIKLTLDIPKEGKCRWLQAVLGLSDPEMQLALNINSYTTLRGWKADDDDKNVSELKRFDRLLEITQLAKGWMSVKDLQEWMDAANSALGGTVPSKVLGDLKSLELVIDVLRGAKQGSPS